MLYGMKGQITLKPNQQAQVLQNVGNARFVWNQFLGMWNARYESNPTLPTLSEYDLNNLLPTLKREYAFLKLSDSTSLQQVSTELAGAFKKFFTNKGHFKHPRFKGKHHTRQSYTAKNVNNSIRYENGYLRLPKIGYVRFRCGQEINGKIKRATIRLTPSGTFECSLLVEDESQVLTTKTNRSVGIDMGVVDLMVLSTGDKVSTIRYDKRLSGKRLYWEQRVARRARLAKTKGIPLSEAKNYQIAKQQRAKVFQKEKNQRIDRLHKLTTALVKEFDVIVLEDLNTASMMKNPHLARSIAAQSWREIRSMLEYKCIKYGKELIVVNPYKTSQICSSCGQDGGKHELSVREWTCSVCHTHHDRDINAAKNILSIGLEQAVVNQPKPLPVRPRATLVS